MNDISFKLRMGLTLAVLATGSIMYSQGKTVTSHKGDCQLTVPPTGAWSPCSESPARPITSGAPR
jgi:hypothetical protein